VITSRAEEDYNTGGQSPSLQKYTGHLQYTSGDTNAANDDEESGTEEWESADSGSVLDIKDFAAFRCVWQNHLGKMRVHQDGLRFVETVSKRELWNRSFYEMVEMKKVRVFEVTHLIEVMY